MSVHHHHHRLLIVDDNRGDITLMLQAIGDAGVAVDPVTADGATAAFALLRALAVDALPDAIVLDLRMPVIDGLTALTILKASAPLDQIPVVVLTSSESPVDRVECLRAGAACYASKPMTIAGYVDLAKSLAQSLEHGFASCGADNG